VESGVPPPTLSDWKHEPNKGYAEEELPPELWEASQSARQLAEKFRARTRERRAANPIPEVLYHYTNIGGLQGMLTSFNIWLTDAAYMNDPQEGTWVHRRASQIIAEILGESPLALQIQQYVDALLVAPDLWDQSLRNGEPSPLLWAAMEEAFMPSFIASFTEADDLLSQWRGYGAGGQGVAIGFDLRNLELSTIRTVPGHPDFDTKPVVVKVEYNPEKQNAEVEWVLSTAKSVYEKHVDILKSNESAKQYFTQQFYYPIRDAFYWLRWEYKSPHYSEEKEWRIIANPVGFRHPKTRVAGEHIVPYLEMPLPQVTGKPNNQLSISRIVLGPKCQPSVLRSVRGLLQNLAFPAIVPSQLSLR
jgi:hypothetical protein